MPFSTVAASVCIPTNCPHPRQHLFRVFFILAILTGCEVISHCDFDLYFSHD